MVDDEGLPAGIWIRYDPPDGATGLYIRYTRDESGRWVISDLYLHGGVLTADMLRAISLSRMEAWMNRSNAPAGIRPASTRSPGTADHDGLTVAELRRRGSTARLGEESRKVIKLERPDGSDPEQFYRRVAAAYREYAAMSKAPARAIANQAEVPVTTVHRWVREARRRGFLPSGRKGRVG